MDILNIFIAVEEIKNGYVNRKFKLTLRFEN